VSLYHFSDVPREIHSLYLNHYFLFFVSGHGPCSAHRQARKLISDRSLATKARSLSFNRTQSRVVTGLLTGHNMLRRHLYLMGLSNNPTCRKCGTEEEISVHILYECEALASLRHTHLDSLFDPEDITGLILEAIWKKKKKKKGGRP
jgi:hypothetical protein